MDSTSATKTTEWYEPEGWPRWLRWFLVGPLPLAIAVVIYFIYSIVNGFFSEGLPSAVTALFAILAGAYVYVVSGRVIAPSFSRLVGYTLASTVLVFAGYLTGMEITQGTKSSPLWYSILLLIVAAGGAVAGAFADISGPNKPRQPEFYSWMPNVLRWLLALPVAIILAVAVDFALGLPLAFVRINEDVIRLINTPLSVVVLISVASAMAPRGKSIVGITIASILAIFAVCLLVGVLDRSLVAQVVAKIVHENPEDFHFSMTPWYQFLSASSVLVGATIGSVGAFEAERSRRRTSPP